MRRGFDPNTLELCDRIMILFFNQEEMQVEILFDGSVKEAERLMTDSNGKRNISTSKLRTNRKTIPIENQAVVRKAQYSDYEISELESGTIFVTKVGKTIKPVKPVLRKICKELGISIFSENERVYNTRRLGNVVLKQIEPEH